MVLRVVSYLFHLEEAKQSQREHPQIHSLSNFVFLIISKAGIDVLLESDEAVFVHVRSDEKCRDVFLPQILVNLSYF